MAKIILFDFDGTIADSFENFLKIINTLSPKYNLPILSQKELETLRDLGARAVIKKLNIPFYKLFFIGRDFKKMQSESISKIKPCKNIPVVLRKLKSNGYILGILTSNAEKNVKEFLKKNEIEIFSYIYTDSSIFGKDKMINNFLKRYNINKNEVIYVGDEIRDIEACKKVKIRIATVTWGFNTKESLEKNKPDFLINKPEELLDIPR